MQKSEKNFSNLTPTHESPPPTYSAWDLEFEENGGPEATPGSQATTGGSSNPATYSELSAPVLLKTMETTSGVDHNAMAPLAPMFRSALSPSTDENEAANTNDWMADHLGFDMEGDAYRRDGMMGSPLPNSISGEEEGSAKKTAAMLEQFLNKSSETYKTMDEGPADHEADPGGAAAKYQLSEEGQLQPVMTSAELRLIKYYNLPPPPPGKYIHPPRNRSRVERLRYLSEIYGYKSRFEGEDMGSMRKLVIKINVALLVFVVVVIIIFVIIKSWINSEEDFFNRAVST